MKRVLLLRALVLRRGDEYTVQVSDTVDRPGRKIAVRRYRVDWNKHRHGVLARPALDRMRFAAEALTGGKGVPWVLDEVALPPRPMPEPFWGREYPEGLQGYTLLEWEGDTPPRVAELLRDMGMEELVGGAG